MTGEYAVQNFLKEVALKVLRFCSVIIGLLYLCIPVCNF